MARPEIPFNQEVAEEICERLAVSIEGVEHIIDDMRHEPEWKDRTPSLSVIYRWLRENEWFQKESARARELKADTLADLRMHYAVTPMIGTVTVESDKGTEVRTADNVARSQLIVQTISKHIGQLAPKKYGEKIEHEHTGKVTLESLVVASYKFDER